MYFLRDGEITASGDAQEVFTKSNIEETFCCRVNVYRDPCNGCPYIIPQADGMRTKDFQGAKPNRPNTRSEPHTSTLQHLNTSTLL